MSSQAKTAPIVAKEATTEIQAEEPISDGDEAIEE